MLQHPEGFVGRNEINLAGTRVCVCVVQSITVKLACYERYGTVLLKGEPLRLDTAGSNWSDSEAHHDNRL